MYPKICAAAIHEIDALKLKSKGIKGVIVDLDNTLVSSKSEHLTEEVRDWVERIKKEGISLCIVSNNWQKKGKKIAKILDVPIVMFAFKPRKRGFKTAMRIIGTKRHETAVIGDQIFTDILGANRLMLLPILVEPLNLNEPIQTRFLRVLEYRFVNRFHEKDIEWM
ncbi:MAG: putative hydrolase of the HAD superfamily [candidate division CPR2 bacterium GW2011_GWC2_39_10]|uniref:Putative hydrolase of the HAD superfamily n=1 Tax=candidate division CPR2 bacterium GW2011_GWC2_39_10 TaxID=1618345 RepID=A0A0G0LQ92_UNCC2|nr:MAG: putative hydrolase of the HAD superfamily [candidate division CPR2 bacterium GW2011_GWC2_39_10]